MLRLLLIGVVLALGLSFSYGADRLYILDTINALRKTPCAAALRLGASQELVNKACSGDVMSQIPPLSYDPALSLVAEELSGSTPSPTLWQEADGTLHSMGKSPLLVYARVIIYAFYNYTTPQEAINSMIKRLFLMELEGKVDTYLIINPLYTRLGFFVGTRTVEVNGEEYNAYVLVLVADTEPEDISSLNVILGRDSGTCELVIKPLIGSPPPVSFRMPDGTYGVAFLQSSYYSVSTNSTSCLEAIGRQLCTNYLCYPLNDRIYIIPQGPVRLDL